MTLAILGKIFLLMPFATHAGFTLADDVSSKQAPLDPNKFGVCLFKVSPSAKTMLQKQLGTKKFQFFEIAAYRRIQKTIADEWTNNACYGTQGFRCDVIATGNAIGNQLWVGNKVDSLAEVERISCSHRCSAFNDLKAVFFINGVNAPEPTRAADLKILTDALAPRKLFIGKSLHDLQEFLTRNGDLADQLEHYAPQTAATPPRNNLCTLYSSEVPLNTQLNSAKDLLKEQQLARYLPALLALFGPNVRPGAMGIYPAANPSSNAIDIAPMPRHLPADETSAILAEIRNLSGPKKEGLALFAAFDDLPRRLTILDVLDQFGWLDVADYKTIVPTLLSKKNVNGLCLAMQQRNLGLDAITKAALPPGVLTNLHGIEAVGCLRPQDVEIHRDLLKLMAGANKDFADEAGQALATIGPKSREIQLRLIEFVVGRDAFLQNPATQALRNARPADVRIPGELFEHFEKSDAPTKRMIIGILSKWAPEDLGIAEAIAANLSSADAALKTLLIEALGNIGIDSPKIAKALIPFIGHEITYTRAQTIAALRSIRTKQEDAQIALVQRLNDSEALVRLNARKVLAELVPQSRGAQLAMIKLATNSQAIGATAAGETLGLCAPHDPVVHDALIKALGSDAFSAEHVRFPLTMSKGLSEKSELEICELLKKTSPSSHSSRQASKVLIARKKISEPAIARLGELLREKDLTTREAAMNVLLEHLPSDLSIQRKIAMLLTEHDPSLRKLALRYFAKVRPRDPSFKTLIDAAKRSE